jgi:DNA invertase Pin-like site-specific DNA recombinase
LKGDAEMARISKSELIRLQKKFKTDARIGEEFGITRQAVHQLRKKYGIESRTAGNPERNKEMVVLRESGHSVEAIAKKFKLSIPQTYRILKETASTMKPAKKRATKKR